MALITVTLFVVCVLVCAATIFRLAHHAHHDPEMGARVVDRSFPAVAPIRAVTRRRPMRGTPGRAEVAGGWGQPRHGLPSHGQPSHGRPDLGVRYRSRH